MYGRPELLSIPLTMITLGMDAHDIVDICCNLMGIISNDLDASRFDGFHTTDVRKLINKHSKEFGSKTTASLLKVYDIA